MNNRGEAVESAKREVVEAIVEADLPRLREARERIRHIPDEVVDEQSIQLARAATHILENDTGFAAECQEADPFRPAFVVLVHGRAMWRCQHEPPHEWPV
jgi:hypothetical protein